MTKPAARACETDIRMFKRDGSEVLRGTASIAGAKGPTALEKRFAEGLPPLQDPVILADVKVGMKAARQRVCMDFDQNMGALYPFSLRRKLAVISEPSWLYNPDEARESQMGTGHRSVRDAQRAFPILLAPRPLPRKRARRRTFRGPGNPARGWPAIRRRGLRTRA